MPLLAMNNSTWICKKIRAFEFISILLFLANVNADPIIETNSGTILGLESETYSNVKFYQFLGIPFAKPPIEDLRFKNAEPLKPWKDIFNATKEKDSCLQLDGGIPNGSLDCLGINIAIPKLPSPNDTNLLPVMVWVHGGAFAQGSGSFSQYKPDHFVNNGVIICNIQYRLGIYGFLSFEDPEVGIPGNVGLKDQIRALQWIKENIIYFGGNPSDITIFGESAGGASTHLLSLSKLGNGLFNKVISQSGVGLCGWASIRRKYKEMAEILKCPHKENQKQISDCIQNKNDSEILDAVQNLSQIDPDQIQKTLAIIFGPVVETYLTDESFLLEPVENIILNRDFERRPHIIGYVSNEGALALGLSLIPLNFTEEFYEELIPGDIKVVKGTKESKELGRKIKEFYYGKNDPSYDQFYTYLDLQTDYQFLIKIYRTVRLYKKLGICPVFFYKFNFVDPTVPWNSEHPDKSIVGHGFELPMEFHIHDPIKTNFTDYVKGEKMITDLWINFAKNSEPTSSTLGFSWLPVGLNNELNLLVMQPNEYLSNSIEELSRMDFWDSVYLKYNNDTLVSD